MITEHFGFVTDRLAIGNDQYLYDDRVAGQLETAGITHVIDCRLRRLDWYERPLYGAIVLHNGTEDDGMPKPVEWFALGIGFVRGALFDPQSKVYIHCQAGLNRSTSLAYGALRSMSYGAKKAEGRIMHARPQAGLLYRDSAERALRVLGFTS